VVIDIEYDLIIRPGRLGCVDVGELVQDGRARVIVKVPDDVASAVLIPTSSWAKCSSILLGVGVGWFTLCLLSFCSLSKYTLFLRFSLDRHHAITHSLDPSEPGSCRSGIEHRVADLTTLLKRGR